MKMNKERFLKTELGGSLMECITAWDKWLEIGDRKAAYWCQAQWEVYKMAVKQFYGIEYCFSRTDEYFGVCTEDEIDWLFKVERQVRGMNKVRRNKLGKAFDLVAQAKDILEEVKEEEREAYDNLPESFRYSDRWKDILK